MFWIRANINSIKILIILIIYWLWKIIRLFLKTKRNINLVSFRSRNEFLL